MKVLVFGTFDNLHPGHIHFLRKSKTYGTHLTVCLARENTVKKFKKKIPKLSEKERRSILLEIDEVNEVVFGDHYDYYKILDSVEPSIICLGYDQNIFVSLLEEELQKRKLQTRIIRISAFQPDKYKSSLLS